MNAGYTVLGYINENLAVSKHAVQVSTDSNEEAALAVDGLAHTTACTLATLHPWFSVDLGAAYPVAHVNIANGPYRNYHLFYSNSSLIKIT